MMKKAYINPETIIMQIATMGMIATSQTQSLTTDVEEYEEGGTLTGARKSSVWDDEEEEEIEEEFSY